MNLEKTRLNGETRTRNTEESDQRNLNISYKNIFNEAVGLYFDITLLGRNIFYIFYNNILWNVTPCSQLVFERFVGSYCLHFQGKSKKQARWRRLGESSGRLYRTTRRYIQHDSTFHSHSCENPKSNNYF